jgi:hypothetical protein
LPLEFERESFSIGFPDLVQRGIVLRPEIRKVEGGRYEFTLEDGEEGLKDLDNAERNGRIVQHLLAHKTEYRKVLLFVALLNMSEVSRYAACLGDAREQ